MHRAVGHRLSVVAAITVAATAAACVQVDPAPNGVASVRLDAAPPSVAFGDSLRDSLGNVLHIHGIAYDATGKVVPTAVFRYAYVPTTPDTTTGAVVDTALKVDSATGAVFATKTPVAGSGRVFVRLGSTIAVADTVQIVPRARSITATTVLDTLRYDCTDPRLDPQQRPASDTINALNDFRFENTVGPFTLIVSGDSLGNTVPVRRWLVRWSLDSVPATPIPLDSISPGYKVPAIAIIANGADQLLSYDTTDATGTSNVRLRIRPTALGKTYVADTLFYVRLRADVLAAGGGTPAQGSPARGTTFVVMLSRRSVPPTGSTAGVTCQR